LNHSPLLVFDFDGVLVDGMVEYWWAARGAALSLRPDLDLPDHAPPGFASLRPLIHKGWEMVLMAAELGRPGFDLDALLAHYASGLTAALARWGWSPEQLQQALESFRAAGIAANRTAWLRRHRFYPGVVERLQGLVAEGAGWMVLTTKGAAFAAELLAAAGLEPLALYGHEAGSKPDVLESLGQKHGAIWFLEDRRPTLEAVRACPALAAVRCYLVSWGYLGPADGQALPGEIRWLTPEAFAHPLADWP
jgi:phosphoglycolate phosphatase-like HAD superfamily hydrolase